MDKTISRFCFGLTALAAGACTEVMGPPDMVLEADSVQVSDAEGDQVSSGGFAFYDGWSYVVNVLAYRIVEEQDARKEPVPTINRDGARIQVLPGVLVDLHMDYFFVSDCTLFPAASSLRQDEEYWQLSQVGVQSKDCAILLPADQLEAQKKGGALPECLLMGIGPEDNGKVVLARTGPNGRLILKMRFTDPDPDTDIQAFFMKLLAISGGASMAFQIPTEAGNVCGQTGGGLAPPRLPSFFRRPPPRLR
ncbi:MAG: hypothetical protein HYT87_07860 [Nitrospirae bacterium]|nr:hypothetical protein [Nitrospirota bacterium]